ncbi:MAG: hypothetical protein H8E13_00065 [Actinobacteria bacterium]|nr:hypothetical protein [Actinomycetota bacterium]
MRKNKLYIVLVILTITFLFTTAAVCTQCGVLGDEGEEAGDADDNRKSADADDSGKEGESKDTNGDKNDSDKKDEPKPEDKKSDDENKQPVIAGIYLDVLDPVHNYFLTNKTYTVKAEAADPEGSNLTFKWSGDGIINGEDINPMTWTAPDSEGVYKITVEATDEKGSTAAMTADVTVEVDSAIGEPLKWPEILDVEILGSNDGLYYQHTVYTIQVIVDDPSGLIDEYAFACNVGDLGQVSAYTVEWESPGDAVDCYITASILDSDGSILDEETIKIKVEPAQV